MVPLHLPAGSFPLPKESLPPSWVQRGRSPCSSSCRPLSGTCRDRSYPGPASLVRTCSRTVHLHHRRHHLWQSCNEDWEGREAGCEQWCHLRTRSHGTLATQEQSECKESPDGSPLTSPRARSAHCLPEHPGWVQALNSQNLYFYSLYLSWGSCGWMGREDAFCWVLTLFLTQGAICVSCVESS